MSAEKRVFIIAEAGVNHNGDPGLALDLVDAAVEAGADAVKFQTFVASELALPAAGQADYQRRATGREENQIAMLRRLELAIDAYPALMARCRERGILFLSTAFDSRSIAFLAGLGLDLWKIPSGEITNLIYLHELGSLGKKIILSTGMSTLDEVGSALDILAKAGTPLERISLLHCTTEYPAPFEDVNLRAMAAMREAFPGVAAIGYSDHTAGIEIPVAAVALGAGILEKHLTLDRAMEGPDHKASLEPRDFAAMVRAVRNVEVAMGDGLKRPTASESMNITVVRKSLVAARNIRAGDILAQSDFVAKRPGTGLSPMRLEALVGKKAPSALEKDSLIPVGWDRE